MNKELFSEKVGYDSYNKKMICRVYDALYNVIEEDYMGAKKTWTNVIRLMFISEGRRDDMEKININGYYSTIRTILKDIKVIRYEGGVLVKDSNWDRFYSDEDWSWFITDTNCGGYGRIVKQ